MAKKVTKEDLLEFGQQLIENVRKAIQQSFPNEKAPPDHPEWLKSRAVRKMLDISAGSLQNLRITGKIRFKKVLGSYYYNREDLTQLFNEKSQP
ncbi:helix-turn-helix domain-containing protein [uncultured Flavobacterium sp.]|uniref:helix-turn-helix domain-containing protein n=1 Tax=uncultured Flavobacterium sp. TaxID=165435 RepID=UPI0025D4112D|nr:helix-turn-helix domain-containing protein [uncultured Flavobacterium sp.]